jgi:hypothetical protein
MSKRQFDSGANRDTDEGKLDYEGFLNPLVLKRFAEYMHKHRKLSDGTLRDSDNWQNGMPLDVYMKSLTRHFMDLWLIHRDEPEEAREGIEDVLCAILFNTQGYLLEILNKKKAREGPMVFTKAMLADVKFTIPKKLLKKPRKAGLSKNE